MASRDGSAEVPGVAEGLVGLGDPDPDPDSVAGPGAPGFVGVGPAGALALGEVDEGDGAVAPGAVHAASAAAPPASRRARRLTADMDSGYGAPTPDAGMPPGPSTGRHTFANEVRRPGRAAGWGGSGS